MNIGFLIVPTKDFSSRKPFKHENENKFLEIFSVIGKKNGFNIMSAYYRDFKNGKVKKAWLFDKKWKKVYDKKIDLIYLYFRFNLKGNKNKAQMKKLKIINNLNLDKISWDKYLTSKMFPEHTMKTYLVNNKKQLEKAVKKIKTEKIVLKPRHGSRGYKIKIIDKGNLPAKVEKGTLVQEFIDSSNGIRQLGIKSRHDFRAIIVDGKIDHCYARIPKQDSFFANCALGAKKRFVPNKKIPKEITKIVEKIDKKFKKYRPRIYTCDFIFDKNQRPHLIEINSQPGAFYYKGHEKTRERYFENIFKAIKKSL